jgi:hypothetical protein
MKKELKTTCFAVAALFLLLAASASAADLEIYTYKLSQSTSAYQFWTTPPSERVFKEDPVPVVTDTAVKVYAAQNEFEPFQIVVKPTAGGNVTVTIGDFGSGITTEIYQVKYVPVTQATDSLGKTGDYPDPLWPIEKGGSAAVTLNKNTAFWFNVFVPKTVAKGDYTANAVIGGVSIPVKLHVFNFAVPDELHVKSQMNFDHNAVLTKYSVSGTGTDYWMYVDKMKQFFIDHRLTSASPLWPGGLTSGGGAPFIGYDCNTATFTDADGVWGFESPAAKYIGGTGFNDGTGFSSFMAATFQTNDASADQRPSTFCGVARGTGDWYSSNNPSSPYNVKWFNYIKAMQNYLQTKGLLDKAYYYFANEPQDQADYDAVAWYSKQLKTAAPNLKLMVSEEPKPEIYTNGKIDLWLPVLQGYNPDVSQAREKNNSEETWVYFLHSTRPPYFNPITLDHPGVESKLTGWFLWKYRVRGLAYYSMNNWSKNPWTDPLNTNHNGDLFMLYPPSSANTNITYGSNSHRFVPSIRFELMRDSLEDYEYLYMLNGGKQPAVGTANAADTQAGKIISGLTSYSRDSGFMYNLRRLIGLKNGGEITSVPDITPTPAHARATGTPGNYYINFQDPAGSPTANPLVVNSKTYMKIGYGDYSTTNGYGWYSPTDANWKYQYLTAGPNELQKSVLYSDYGRQATFEFDLPNGKYNVTVSVGWQGKTYSHNQIVIESVEFIMDEASSPYIVRTKEVTVSDNKLTLAMGVLKNDEYTMLNYLDIEAVDGTTTPECTDANWTYSDGECQSSSTLTRTWTKTGDCTGGVSHSATESIACTYQPPTSDSAVMIDFGKTETGNIFGLTGWNTVIKDKYTDYRDLGPGGVTITAGNEKSYNYQGVRGTARTFKENENIVVTWYNNSDAEITFTPKISFNDSDRPDSGVAGTWQNMSAVTVSARKTAESTFTFAAASAGTYSLVNVNVNYSNSLVAICDKIELKGGEYTPPTPTDGDTVTLADFGKTATANMFGLTGWSSALKDKYTDYKDIGPGGTTIVTGAEGTYNYQGVQGSSRTFADGEKIAVTWYNNSAAAINFTPKISFDDPDRPITGTAAGTWNNMSATAVPAKGTAQSTFTFDASSAGTYSLVNVNVNYGNNQLLICDKIELILKEDNGGEDPPANEITVSNVTELKNAFQNLTADLTILLADGTYSLNGAYLWIDKSGVTLRSESGNREAVIIDGGYVTTEIILIVASNVTVADLTLKRAKYHPIHVMGGDSANTENTVIENVHIIDPGEQAIKINANSAKTFFADAGVIEGCRIELSDTGRAKVLELNGSCYTGGIDGHGAKDWEVRDNEIEGFWCTTGLSEHGIHFWSGSRGTLVERNTLVDNARGIGFGLGQSGSDWRTYSDSPCSGISNAGHYLGIIRNNFIFQTRQELYDSGSHFESGIGLEQACGVKAVHNTVVSTKAPVLASAEWRFSGTTGLIANNIFSHNMMPRDSAAPETKGNLQNAALSIFADGAGGNLHLSDSAAQAVDAGAALDAGLCDDDFDGQKRDAKPDIGADEKCNPPLGDLDSNCSIDFKDAVLALQVLAAKDVTARLGGDINSDQKIGLAEAIYALQKAAGIR